MYFKPLLIPLFVQVLLSFVVMYVMGRKRVAEMKKKRIHPQKADIRVHSSQIFQEAAKVSDNYANQFESPVLFYVAILLTLILLIQDSIMVVLAWTYVGLRLVHSFIHISYNRVIHRFLVFVLGSFVLFALWVRLGWILIQS